MDDDLFWLSWLRTPVKEKSYPEYFIQTYKKNPTNGLWLFVGRDAISRARARASVPCDRSVTAAIDPNQINPNAYIWDIKGWEILMMAHKDVPDIQLRMTAQALKEGAAGAIRACRCNDIIIFRESKQ